MAAGFTIAIASGKGGTGKISVVALFAGLAAQRVVESCDRNITYQIKDT